MSLILRERSPEEQEAANIVANLHNNGGNASDMIQVEEEVIAAASGQKRSRDEGDGDMKPAAKPRLAASAAAKPPPKAKAKTYTEEADDDEEEEEEEEEQDYDEEEMDATARVFLAPELKPAPYFYYSDHSLEEDPDPLTPITASGHVPTFPAKMHAILTNPKLNGIVAWADHGRAWTILKPRAFEVGILPKYFEHSKFSSFVRQANGWGFRRLSSGNDRNTYYHEYFLRGMPWLVKKMRRPRVNEKKSISPQQEPGFVQISEEFPVPDRPLLGEILVLQRIMEKGAKARMPVNWELEPPEFARVMAAAAAASAQDEGDYHNVEGMIDVDHELSASSEVAAAPLLPQPELDQLQQLAAMRQMNRAAVASLAQPPAARMNDSDDSGFAAGFMAATAYHNRQVQNIVGNALMSGMPVDSLSSFAALSPNSGMNRFQGLQGNNSIAAAMMGARPNISDLALAQQLQVQARPNVLNDRAAAMMGARPNISSDFALAQQLQIQARPNVLNDLAMARQLQLQAYYDYLNGHGASR